MAKHKRKVKKHHHKAKSLIVRELKKLVGKIKKI